METTINTGYPQILDLVRQLPEKDIQKLVEYIQIKFAVSEKNQVMPKTYSAIQELVMQAPTWTDEEYNNFLETRQHINQSRLK
jgi:ADP-dependent phosphofructokinase/glucokinase